MLGGDHKRVSYFIVLHFVKHNNRLLIFKYLNVYESVGLMNLELISSHLVLL